jgi:cation:H+ antiporter
MQESLALALWFAAILAGIGAMQWGVQRVCALLVQLRRHWGIAEVGGGALIGFATATPELSVNIASVAMGWPDIGLGTALGSNVPALPLIFVISYLTTRWHRPKVLAERSEKPDSVPRPSPVPQVKDKAVWVQVLPYLLVVLLLAALTLPPGWSGLQPIDGLILLLACGAFLWQALRMPGERVCCHAPVRKALATLPGILAIGAGALIAVLASRRVNEALGIPDLVGGLFITGLLCALPESFSAWRLSRAGRATSAVSAAVSDGVFSLTLALVPLCLIGARVGDMGLYALNLGFLVTVLGGYMAMSIVTPSGAARISLLTSPRVLVFALAYGAYVAVALRLTV